MAAAVTCFAMISPMIVSHAADGILHFSDPTGKVCLLYTSDAADE